MDTIYTSICIELKKKNIYACVDIHIHNMDICFRIFLSGKTRAVPMAVSGEWSQELGGRGAGGREGGLHILCLFSPFGF